jgi:diguanylate cyclase (GGDEF)-like protein
MNLTEFLGEQRKSLLAAIGLALFGLICWADHLAGRKVEISIWYVLPVSFFSWYFNRRVGFGAAMGSAVLLLVTKRILVPPSLAADWNILTWLGLYIFIVLIISQLNTAYRQARERSLTDDLTHIPNRRAFFLYLNLEKNRDRRYGLQLTLAYIDLDGFKALNDRLGHAAGDEVLVHVAKLMREQVRATDFVARIGGDEFAILLPQTGVDAAAVVLRKLQQTLNDEMKRNHWDVSFSIGAVTYGKPPDSVQEIVAKADEVMYSVKLGGKSGLKLQDIAA